MGFLQDFVKDKMNKEHTSRLARIDALTALSKDPRQSEEAQEWAFNELIGSDKELKKQGETIAPIFKLLKGIRGAFGGGGQDQQSSPQDQPPMQGGDGGMPPPVAHQKLPTPGEIINPQSAVRTPPFVPPQQSASMGQPAPQPPSQPAPPPQSVRPSLRPRGSREMAELSGEAEAIKTRAGIEPAVESARAMIKPTVELETAKRTALDPLDVKKAVDTERQKGVLNWEDIQRKLAEVEKRVANGEDKQDLLELFFPGYARPASSTTAMKNFGTRTIERGGKKIIEYFDQADPSQVVHSADAGRMPEVGNYSGIVDAQGNLMGFFNPKTERLVDSPIEGGRRTALPAGENLQQASTEVVLQDLNTLEQLGLKNRGSIGPVQGRLAAVKRATVGTSDEVNEMFRIADNISDQLLRLRSGAQINEAEYGRLRSLLPNPRGPEGKFFSDLTGFRSEMTRLLSARRGQEPVAPTTPGASVAGATGQPYNGPTGTLNGRTIIVNNGRWVYQDTGEEAR